MENRLFFPIFLDLTGKRILVVGAGRIATRRIRTLLPFGAALTVVASEPSDEVAALAREGRLTLHERPFEEADLEGAVIVLSAAGEETDKAVAAACRARGIPVNASSDIRLDDFYFPGIARRDNIVIGITASGTDHKAAHAVSQAVREFLNNKKEC